MKGNSDKEFSEFIPDGVFTITNAELKKSLLFFLEVDMGTETVASPKRDLKDIRQKIVNYQALFRTGQYKRYEKILKADVNGFRFCFWSTPLPGKKPSVVLFEKCRHQILSGLRIRTACFQMDYRPIFGQEAAGTITRRNLFWVVILPVRSQLWIKSDNRLSYKFIPSSKPPLAVTQKKPGVTKFR